MSDETLELLKRVAKDVADIKAAMAASVGASGAALGVSVSGGSGGGGGVASDADLDSEHGNPVIRKDPKRWNGESFAGKTYSEASPDYLAELASFLEWCADKEEKTPGKEKYARYSRRDAARARGWAARLRSGWKPASGTGGAPQVKDEDYDDAGFGGDSEIPF